MNEVRKRAIKKRAKKNMKRIVESVIGRFIYDVLKHIYSWITTIEYGKIALT